MKTQTMKQTLLTAICGVAMATLVGCGSNSGGSNNNNAQVVPYGTYGAYGTYAGFANPQVYLQSVQAATNVGDNFTLTILTQSTGSYQQQVALVGTLNIVPGSPFFYGLSGTYTVNTLQPGTLAGNTLTGVVIQATGPGGTITMPLDPSVITSSVRIGLWIDSMNINGQGIIPQSKLGMY